MLNNGPKWDIADIIEILDHFAKEKNSRETRPVRTMCAEKSLLRVISLERREPLVIRAMEKGIVNMSPLAAMRKGMKMDLVSKEGKGELVVNPQKKPALEYIRTL